MLNSLRNLLLVVVAVHTFHAARAFQPALTEVEASLTTNGFSHTVHYWVEDPVLKSIVLRNHEYAGNVSSYWLVTNLTVSTGIVAWVANAAGAYALRDREIGCAVYDPARQEWQERTHRYEGGSSSFWTLTPPSITNGVVVWQANGSGLASGWNTEIGFATYDPLPGAWKVNTHRYTGTDSSYWVITNRQTASGLVTWTRNNVGQFALGHKEVNYAIFDSTTSSWMEGSQYYEGRLNNAWAVLNQRIASQTVTWTATNRNETHNEVRGYQPPQRLWNRLPTTATAAFATSATTGGVPLSVWFTDLSIGATNWSWNFGDGTNATARSLLHVFQQPGAYTVTQTVRGPGGTNAASITLGVDTAPGFLAFDTARVTVTNDLVRLPILGASGVHPVILYASSNLVNWEAISTNPPQAEPIELTAPVVPSETGQFYRAVVRQSATSGNAGGLKR